MTSGRFDRVIVMTGQSAAGWARAQMALIHAALRTRGIAAELIPVEAGGGFIDQSPHDRMLVIDANQKVKIPPGIRKFSMMVDHPCSRIGDLVGADLQQTRLGWVDETHLPAAHFLGLPFRSGFLPHAGPDVVADTPDMAARDIDVFFSGLLADPIEATAWRLARSKLPPVVTSLVFGTVERILSDGSPALPAFLTEAARLGIDVVKAVPVETLCELVTTIQQIAEANRRIEILLALPATARITIAAYELPRALQNRPNITYLGPIDDFDAIRRLMRRARIVLNSTSKFPAGAHERIWFAMAEGAVALTDASRFVTRDFEPGTSILELPKPGQPLDQVAALIAEPAALDQIAAAARPIYRAGHTWQRRIETLLALAEA